MASTDGWPKFYSEINLITNEYLNYPEQKVFSTFKGDLCFINEITDPMSQTKLQENLFNSNFFGQF